MSIRAFARLVALPLLLPIGVHAQEAGDRIRVRVTPAAGSLSPRTLWAGTLVRADADSVVLRDGSRRRAFARADVQQMWVRGELRSRARGAALYGLPFGLLGGALGYTFGTALNHGGDCPLEPGASCTGGMRVRRDAVTAAGALTFGGLGALYGATAGHVGWVPLAGWRGTTLRVTPARVAVSIPLPRR